MNSFTFEDIRNAWLNQPPPKDKPDMIWVASHWTDDQLRQLINSGAGVYCDMPTWKRIVKLREEE